MFLPDTNSFGEGADTIHEEEKIFVSTVACRDVGGKGGGLGLTASFSNSGC